MSETKGFPLRKGVACQLKWTWNTIRLAEATSASCHRVKGIPLTKENFINIHNHSVWVEHRRMMLDGKFPDQGCQQYCGFIESHNGFSDRMLHLEEEGIYPQELDKDPEAVEVTPRALEIFLDNACNLSCIYCDESNSTRIVKENQKFGHQVPGVNHDNKKYVFGIIPIHPRTNDFNELTDDFFKFLDKNYLSLRILNVLGGEPFYQKSFSRLVNFVETHRNPDLTLTVVTNLMTSRSVLEKFLDSMRKVLISRRLKALHMTVSIDCLGPEQEYIRYGFDESQCKSNLEYLLKHKWVYVTVNSTITSLSIKSMPLLVEYINDQRRHREVHHSFGMVDGRPNLHPGIFGPEMFAKDFNKIISLMPNTNSIEFTAKQYFEGIANAISNAPEDKELQQHLVLYLNEIDRRRNLNWQDVFPWLNEYMRINYVV